jgi:flagellar biosynthesis protein
MFTAGSMGKLPPNKSQRRAAVVSYNDLQSMAPRVVAKGYGETADKIIDAAILAGVPVTRSEELSAALMNVDLSREISPELYLAVAEILTWVWSVEVKKTSY